VKVLEKRHIIREKKAQYVSREKEVLSRLNHPFFVRLYFTFQDKEKLCILTTKTLCAGISFFYSITCPGLSKLNLGLSKGYAQNICYKHHFSFGTAFITIYNF